MDAVSAQALRLELGHGHFVVLDDNGVIRTCYTDRGDTSRSSMCSPAVIIKFARDVLFLFGVEPGRTINHDSVESLDAAAAG